MAADERKVGRHHLAFYRGWVQGMDLAVVASKYLEIGLDLRLARSTHAWLRDTLSQAALRQGRRGEARLLRMSLRHVLQSQDGNQPAASTNPTLEQFREEHDPDDFYSEDELIAMFMASEKLGHEQASLRISSVTSSPARNGELCRLLFSGDSSDK